MINPFLAFAPAFIAVGVLFALHRWQIRRFDRKYPHLSHNTLREAEPEDLA